LLTDGSGTIWPGPEAAAAGKLVTGWRDGGEAPSKDRDNWSSCGESQAIAMNHYGMMARQHWARWLPRRYSQIQNPNSFFSTLGEEVSQAIAALAPEIAGGGPPGETYLARVGRLNAARRQAEETVLKELVLLDPEPEVSEDPAQDLAPGQDSGVLIPGTIRPGDPMWDQVSNDRQDLGLDS
jgi:hypothetical protein